MMLKKSLLFLVLSLFLALNLRAQTNKTDSLANVLERYDLHNRNSVLFVHFDKNIYTNNDQVWFTGYLLKTIVGLAHYNTLYLSLVRDADSSVVLQQKFLIEKGYTFGSLILPDSLQSGSYRFVANTNIKFGNKPDVEFLQPITIKSTTINPLVASLSLFKAGDETTGNGTVLLKALTGDNRFVADAEVSYTIGRDRNILKTGKAKTSVIGEMMIDFPANRLTNENNLVSVSVKKGASKEYLNFEIPIKEKVRFQVSFFPEGGYMVSGIQNKVGWEVKDRDELSISAKAVLFADDKVLDTISTDLSGLGNFYLKPESGKSYKVKLLNENKLIGSYALPESLKQGTVIRLNSAIGNDEIRAVLQSNIDETIHLVVHNQEKIFLVTALDMKNNRPLKVLLKLDSVPKGLNTITLFDGLYRPIAERIFFAHYNELSKLEILPEGEEFKTRDSVKLNLQVSSSGKLLNGLVSIAVVQGNRINLSGRKNIVDFAYLENHTNELPPSSSGIKLEDLNYLENVLLIKGWRKYKWPHQVTEGFPQEKTISAFEYRGEITKGKKMLKVPISLTTIAGSNLNAITTDSLGKFVLPYSTLITEDKPKIWLTINDRNFSAYNVNILNPFSEIKSFLRSSHYAPKSQNTSVLQSGSEGINALSGIKLKDVTIKKVKDNSMFFASNMNKCGDYVCGNGYLNCPNHRNDPKNKPAENNRSYKLFGGGTTVYGGCSADANKPNLFILDGISLPKEFYVADLRNLNEPINFSTIYWNYQTAISKTGDTSLTFTTGDLSGEFKIIIQGITDNGPVYAEKTITVKK